jgi:AcrR family transcriptional regulator
MTTTTAPEDTRSRVLAVALELIADKGFSATSTREVSERMGFTKAALHYHFKAKDDLLEALVTPLVAALTSLVESAAVDPSPSARRSAVVRYVHLVADHSDVMRVAYEDPSVRNHPSMAPARPLYRRLFQLFAGSSAPDTAGLARARAAAGAVHAALLRGEPTEDPLVLRTAAAAAACGALGVPAPRSS